MTDEMNGIVLSVNILMFIISIVIAIRLEKRRQAKEGTRPYTWGYCVGVYCILTGVAVLGLLIAAALQGAMLTVYTAALIIGGSICIWLGLLINKRIFWAFVVATVLSFNPVAYIINGVYVYHRRKELN